MSVSSLYFVSQHSLHSSAGAMSPIHGLASTTMDPLQDPCLRIHVSASFSHDPLQDPCLRIHVSTSSYLRILCKIHVSDSCLSIHQYGSSTRSTSSDSRLRIHVSDSCLSIHNYIDPLQDPCRGILNCEAVTASISQDLCLSIPILGPYRQDPCSWSPLPRHESLLACVFTLKTELSAA